MSNVSNEEKPYVEQNVDLEQTPRINWLKLLSDVANDDSIPPILRLGDGQMPSSVYRHNSQPEAK